MSNGEATTFCGSSLLAFFRSLEKITFPACKNICSRIKNIRMRYSSFAASNFRRSGCAGIRTWRFCRRGPFYPLFEHTLIYLKLLLFSVSFYLVVLQSYLAENRACDPFVFFLRWHLLFQIALIILESHHLALTG